MSKPLLNHCQCSICQETETHPDKEKHAKMNLFLSRLDEGQRRWYVAIEAERIGHGGEKQMSLVTGLDEKTIRRGKQELASGLSECPEEGIRNPGGGRWPVEKKRRKLKKLSKR